MTTTNSMTRFLLLPQLSLLLLFLILRPISAVGSRPPSQSNDKDLDNVKAAINVSLARAKDVLSYVSKIPRQPDPRAAGALHDCIESFDDAVDSIGDSLHQMSQLSPPSAGGGESFRFQMGNVNTWLSAASTDAETCTEGFNDVVEGPLKDDVLRRVEEVKKVISNALALAESYARKVSPPP